jgi:hypothetical protein
MVEIATNLPDKVTMKLGEELIGLRSKYEPFEPRDKEICSKLKLTAETAAENYKITIPKKGIVKVSAPREKECTGIAPELNVEAFLNLSEKQQSDLTERGVVKMARQYKGAYYGSVTVELF